MEQTHPRKFMGSWVQYDQPEVQDLGGRKHLYQLYWRHSTPRGARFAQQQFPPRLTDLYYVYFHTIPSLSYIKELVPEPYYSTDGPIYFKSGSQRYGPRESQIWDQKRSEKRGLSINEKRQVHESRQHQTGIWFDIFSVSSNGLTPQSSPS